MANVIYTVSQFNRDVRQLLESNYKNIWIEGEISNLAAPSSGHLYFTLKDEEAQIRCALFRNRRLNLPCNIENGLAVQLLGQVSLYETRGEFQIIVDYVELAGEGALRRKFEELKKKLDREGLFDVSRKKPIPRIPLVVGVITSPTGAAIRDILATLKRRYPIATVLVYPVRVQGDQAKSEIVQALSCANNWPLSDVLILSRGGGSLEDLWVFNEEVVVRAIDASQIPVVAGIGHEVDVTLSDLAADHRAATPTAAAEAASPDRTKLIIDVDTRYHRLQIEISHILQRDSQNLDLVTSNLHHPINRIYSHLQRLANIGTRATFASRTYQHRQEIKSLRLQQRLHIVSPHLRLDKDQILLANLHQRLNRLGRKLTDEIAREISSLAARLHGLSPAHTLQRGYTILRDTKDGQVISSATMVNRGQTVEAELARGWLYCTVEGRKTTP